MVAMCRLCRWLFHALSVLSVLLCIATCVLWVRGNWDHDNIEFGFATRIHWPTRGYLWGIESSGKRLRLTSNYYFDHHESDVDDRLDMPRWLFRCDSSRYDGFPLELDHGDETAVWGQRVFGYESQTMHGPRSIMAWSTVIISHWIVIIATMPLTVVGMFRLFRRALHARPSGTCFSCGYDLRATPERCPECGTIPTGVKV